SSNFAWYAGTVEVYRAPGTGTPALPIDLVTLGYLQTHHRQLQTAASVYYVSATGSDATGDGSATKPWATLQHAVNWVQANVDFAGRTVTIQLADGTYSGGLSVGGSPIGATAAGQLVVQGNPANAASVTVDIGGSNACFVVQAGGSVWIKHL